MERLRAILTLVASLLLLMLAMAFRSPLIDQAVRVTVWGGVLVGSVVIVIRTLRRRS